MRLRRLYNIIRFWDRTATLKDQPVFAIHEEPEPVQERGSSGETADLRRELAKLGKIQLRAQAVTESALEAIGETVEGLKAALDRMGEAWSSGLTEELLLVADGLEEAIHAGEAMMEAEHLGGTAENGLIGPSPGSENGWMEGIRIIHRRVCQILDKEGIRPIPSVGESFDPQVHIAVGVEQTFEVPDNTIIEEQRKGYKRGNQVIRYAEVVVAKPLSNDRKDFPHPTLGEESDEQDHWH